MKKAKKGLLLSLLTLLMAVAVTATSTYAWFVTSRSVQATNMQVTLKSDTTYLVISATDPGEGGVASLGTGISAAATASSAQVLPARYNENATPASGDTNWEYASGTNYSNGQATGGYTPVAEANVGQYAVHYVFYVGLTPTTAVAQRNLKVQALSAAVGTANSTFLGAISVVLKCGSTVIDFEDINLPNAKINTDNAILSSQVALNTVYTIDAWVYVNGDNTSVTSANAVAAALGSFTVSMTLTCDAPAA